MIYNRSGTVTRVLAFGLLLALSCPLLSISSHAAATTGQLSGRVTDPRGSVVPGARLKLTDSSGTILETASDEQGNFKFRLVDPGTYSLTAESNSFVPLTKTISIESGESNCVEMRFVALVSKKSVVIVSSTLEPAIDRRNDEVYKKTLFGRDDQLLETLNAGINAGQHEGGGKSLEIRRFGFNLDHGGVNGGLKVLVDDIQQNQGTQGHGQGYLGSLKAVTPELVQEVTILNGPFSAEYGDFSGLGVVHIRLKESLPDQLTLRSQTGSFDSYRTFAAYSPSIENVDSFLSYEGSRTDGPFLNPLRYKRDNVTGNYTWKLQDDQAVGFKMNFGRNYFYSSGQIPLDLVAEGQLHRFGFVDPTDGGRVRLGTVASYYGKQFKSGDSLKLDGFLSRSLFDLYSDFTFFLSDPVHGDGIQQHDSRYQEGSNSQYLHFHNFLGARALLTLGSNFHDNQINVGLYPREGRVPLAVTTRAYAHVTNTAGYGQEAMDFLHGRLHLEGGLRWDYFRFGVDDRVNPNHSGVEGASRLQPKAGVAYTPSFRIPLTLYFNYGRGINTQDARGVVERPSSPRIATTDFYQLGTSHHFGKFSLSTDMFLIDRSNEQVYIPDDGTFEFKGPSRSYGYEAKTSIQVMRYLALNGGLTQVANSFYRATLPRVYVDSAPHNAGNAALTFSGWRGFYASLRYRHIGNYRLDGMDPTIRASGLDVLDLAATKQLRRWVDFNFDIDNLTDKLYYETQNYFVSRVRPTDPAVPRIHGTPGYPMGVTVGLTFHLFGKAR